MWFISYSLLVVFLIRGKYNLGYLRLFIMSIVIEYGRKIKDYFMFRDCGSWNKMV